MRIIYKIIYLIGREFMEISEEVGSAFKMFLDVFQNLIVKKYDRKNITNQMIAIGVMSIPVIVLTSAFTGMVLALQTAYSTKNIFNEPIYIGSVVGFSIVKELGPVLTAMVIAGRVGAAIAAELGTMKVTEQIDALHLLGTNPVKYLAVPRFISIMIMLPILTVFADIIGILGGFFVSIYKLGIAPAVYKNDILDYMRIEDLMHGLIKVVFFALIIVTVACHKGFNCEGGAEGVGRATTQTVVISMVMILVSDYFLTALLVLLGVG
ncbi:MAG: ABC transporter permease [Elusimicrobia bacterium]|nr:ABC transporter permease [Elusimicrobiota bacterium]